MINPEKMNYPVELNDPYYFKDPFLFELYKKCLPPKEAYLFFPKGDEIVIPNLKKPQKTLRRIHWGVEFFPFEKEWISKFNEIIKAHPETPLPPYWDDSYNLTFIYATEANLDQAYERMIRYFEWHNSFFPLTFQPEDNNIKLLNSGFMYIYGRDHHFRPIIVIQPYIIIRDSKLYSPENIMNVAMFLSEFMVNNMLIPGQIENWISFLNANDLSITSIPEPLKKVISALSKGFLARLYKAYVFGMTPFLRVLFILVTKFLEECTRKKIVIIKNLNDENLFTDFNRQNLQVKFGGLAPDPPLNEPHGLFPPRMPSDNFFQFGEDPKDLLISEKKYIELLHEGKIVKRSISPYILEKLKKEKEIEERQKNEAETEDNSNNNINYWAGNREFNSMKELNYKTKRYKEIINDINKLNNEKNSFIKNIFILDKK